MYIYTLICNLLYVDLPILYKYIIYPESQNKWTYVRVLARFTSRTGDILDMG